MFTHFHRSIDIGHQGCRGGEEDRSERELPWMPQNEGANLELWANAIEHEQGAHAAQLGGWADTRGRAHIPKARPPATIHVLALDLAEAQQLGLAHAPPKDQRPQDVPPKDGGFAARALPSEADVH